MDGIVCDRCGRALLVDHDVRYVAEIKVYAAYDPLEITRQDLENAGDPAVWERLFEELRNRSAEELEAEVFKRFAFDLCPPCQRVFLASPLPPLAPQPAGTAPAADTANGEPPSGQEPASGNEAPGRKPG